jgi:hypothetical protein
MGAFGVHPDRQCQLAKFASIQDRLREWNPDVMSRLATFSCMAIAALDFDAIRVDKATQVTVDALATSASTTRACAAALGINNFITGEVTGGDTFGALYLCAIFCFRIPNISQLTCFQWARPHSDHAFTRLPSRGQLDRHFKSGFSSAPPLSMA